MSCGVGHRSGSDLVLLRLWRRPAAVALIIPLAWEPPHTMGVALKKIKDKKNLQTINAGKCAEERVPSYIVGGNVNWYNHYGNSMDVPQKTTNRTTI